MYHQSKITWVINNNMMFVHANRMKITNIFVCLSFIYGRMALYTRQHQIILPSWMGIGIRYRYKYTVDTALQNGWAIRNSGRTADVSSSAGEGWLRSSISNTYAVDRLF